MAKIIEFPRQAERSHERGERGKASVARTQSAEIIIFPGVRIERIAVEGGTLSATSSVKTSG